MPVHFSEKGFLQAFVGGGGGGGRGTNADESKCQNVEID